MKPDCTRPRDNALGDLLRARRGLISPEQAGLAGRGPRRVPGLRREEVALLAGVSTDYYIRLEQGRERHPSQQVIDALGRALRLDEDTVAHLGRVARPAGQRSRRRGIECVSPELLTLLNGWPGTPALVVGPTLDVLALNSLASALYAPFGRPDNLLRMTFLRPQARAFHRDWDHAARASVAALRNAAGEHPYDPELTDLVDELCLKSTDFRTLWAGYEVRAKTGEAKHFRHPQVGELDLHYESFGVNSAPGQQLIVYQAEPGSPSAGALSLLAAPAAEPVELRSSGLRG